MLWTHDYEKTISLLSNRMLVSGTCYFVLVLLQLQMWSCHQDRALEDNPTLPFATIPELFPDPGRDIQSRVGSYFGFKNKENMESRGPELVAYFFHFFVAFCSDLK